jgi:phospholipid-translocating ATPase
LLLASSEPHGLCYIETAELDGETNLKVRQALSETAKQFDHIVLNHQGGNQDNDHQALNHEMSKLDFSIECEAPNELLNQFEGTLRFNNGETVSLDNDKMLLRGCRLRNTRWCYGVVVFAGADTKLMKNGGKTKFKQTHIDKLLNYLIMGIVMFLLTICVICTIACGIWESFRGFDFQTYLPWESFVSRARDTGSLVISLLVFPSYLIILNTVVPISLYVSVEFIRSIQSLWINWDMKMYYDKTDIPAKARTTTLNEELGQIEYIFSDKTGTLTQNIMTFNKCSINGVLYGYLMDAQGNDIEINEDETMNNNIVPIDFSFNPYYESTFRFYDQSLLDAIDQNDENCCRFFTLLCICHTVMAEEKNNVLTYQAQSPDEGALVSAARNFGFVFKSRTPKTITCIVRGEEKTYEVLHILDFNNVRKRMSVICRIEGKIVLFCKGADTIIKERLCEKHFESFERSEEHLNRFAEDALRTLCLAWKEISDEEYEKWRAEHHEASTSLDNRHEKVSQVYEQIEQDLMYVGSTAIEDKLQDGVPECIAKLAQANIKIWVLTGDKLETAINIGFSCQLLTNDMEVFTIEAKNEQDLLMQIREKKRTVKDAAQNKITYQYDKNNNFVEIQMKPTAARAASSTNFISTSTTDFALVITGQSLVYALTAKCELEFLDLACMCKAVICCRVTPGQKKAVVDLVKTHKKAITLAIGDGANDVSMIKSAHIGVGISGQEGQQAVLASDFSIGQFRYLERLLLVHGRWSYYRISKFLRYFFYKNFASTLCHFWFAFFCGFSAQVRNKKLSNSFQNLVKI